MPNIVSAEKRLRQNKKRNMHNRMIKSTLNTLKRKVVKFVLVDDKESALNVYKDYASAIDKAARKSIVHANRAAAKKSALMEKINKIK